MNKQELAERLARQSHRSRAEAADRVDRLVYDLLKDLPATNVKPGKSTGQKSTTKQPAASKGSPAAKPERRKS